MQKIQPCLWFDTQAEQAAALYTSLFPGARVLGVVPYGKAAADASGQREGSTMTVEYELAGQKFLALNGGPHFPLNPAISFFVGCESEQEIDRLWNNLCKVPRMELKKYPWSEKYGWCEDRYGVNWQLSLGRRRQKITPALLFANERFGQAAQAIEFYVAQFARSKVDMIARDDKTQAVLHSVFTLDGCDFSIMEGPLEHQFGFTPAISFIVHCASQAEIDDLWRKLSAAPEAEQCGWLRDRFGISWQVLPQDWPTMLANADPARRERLARLILAMKKPEVARLEQAT